MKPVRWRDRYLAASAIVVAVIAIWALTRLDIGYDRKLAPFVIDGRIGTPATARAFVATVESVELAHTIAAVDDARDIALKPLTTPGVWMVVHARLQARSEPVTLASANLRSADGFDYAALGSRAQAAFKPSYAKRLLNMLTTAPGLPNNGLLIFELPPTRIAGAHLRVSQALGAVYLDNVVDIDLGLDANAASALLAHAAPQFIVRDGAP